MTLEQLDQLLSDWRKKIDLVGQNLIELCEQTTYQRLTGEARFPSLQLTGTTAARVIPALEAMNELFQHFDLLVKTVEEATELRKQVPRFLGAEPKIHEIEQLLSGDSIQLPITPTPMAQRELLTAAETLQAIAPEKLLAIMTNAFQVARDTVLAVDKAWSHLEPKLAEAEAEILSLQNLANSLGASSISELSTARQKIVSLRNNIECDPLGVSIEFEREIKPLTACVRATLEQTVAGQRQIREILETGHELLKKLVEVHGQAEKIYAESREKVGNYPGLQIGLAPESIDALKQWLIRLETKFGEGLINPVHIGLKNWIALVKESIAKEEQTIKANNAPLQTRRELRGRLDALVAKALARGVIEDTILVELAQQAKQLLYTRPTPLDRAAELLSEYEKRLNRRI